MKKIIFTLVSLFILFAGCKENIIDPVTQDSLNKIPTTNSTTVQQGKILLEGILNDPSVPFVEYYNLNGYVLYELRLLSGPEPIAKISLSLSVNATLKDIRGNEIGSVFGTATDTLYVNEFGSLLEISFPVQGIGNNHGLVCSFFITSDSIILSGRWLAIK